MTKVLLFIAAFVMAIAATTVLALLLYCIEMLREYNRGMLGVPHTCEECVDFEPRLHKGFCYLTCDMCKKTDPACKAFRKR